MERPKIGIIGGGNMGGAIAGGLRRKYAVAVCEQDKARAMHFKRKLNIRNLGLMELIQTCSVIILAVKPQDIDPILQVIRDNIKSRQLIISIAAGLTTGYLERKLGKGVKVIRTMPNLPAQIGQGITAICRGRYAAEGDLSLALRLFENIGRVVRVSEKDLDAVTAVSGSGPAYVFYFVECLNKGARQLGLNKDLASKLIDETLRGSLALLHKSREEARVLRERVTSKGGTTQAALNILQGKRVDRIYSEALKAAKQRAKELSKK